MDIFHNDIYSKKCDQSNYDAISIFVWLFFITRLHDSRRYPSTASPIITLQTGDLSMLEFTYLTKKSLMHNLVSWHMTYAITISSMIFYFISVASSWIFNCHKLYILLNDLVWWTITSQYNINTYVYYKHHNAYRNKQ